ncbi:hypothetical protein MJO28_016116 [Puccinia striiformis f. sp. tritici]|uniref:Uncharacterized protein n=1 Tax=Puccinia striiformis f. sp. tritici TaxID=168172 RepID=A0ACC0DRU7_9BASI|nr:hypothetical protein MJO29_015277 [Puccinia striiformis f. sp. tritici]KAI7937217.1 hypothetical protein MJO28_016116 [Puccinia striiformis f. sp. tritici]
MSTSSSFTSLCLPIGPLATHDSAIREHHHHYPSTCTLARHFPIQLPNSESIDSAPNHLLTLGSTQLITRALKSPSQPSVWLVTYDCSWRKQNNHDWSMA